jgi:hypothetical protein
MAAAAIEMNVRYDIGFLSEVSQIIATLSARKSEQNSSHPDVSSTPKLLEGWAAADPLTDGEIYEAVILRADSSRTAKSGKVLDAAKK